MSRLSLFRALLSVVYLLLLAASPAVAGQPSPPQFGQKWKVLIGEWKGENEAGAPAGACGFHFDLSDHIIVRTNHAELSGSGGPAHNDLMIISPDAAEDKARASYFDNEGHLIEYTATWSADGNSLTFLSKPGPGPQFRLTYKKLNPDSFSVNFEMAPPGQAAAFRKYTSGRIVRLAK